MQTAAPTDFCVRCTRTADERTIISERWGYWLVGGLGMLLYCPRCAEASFGHAGARPQN